MKFAVLHVHGQLAVWTFYSARLAIGFLVGISVWPARWWLRGPLCGLASMWPVSLVALAVLRSRRRSGAPRTTLVTQVVDLGCAAGRGASVRRDRGPAQRLGRDHARRRAVDL
jgi:hypothetical protein